jgi:hypothetical protein
VAVTAQTLRLTEGLRHQINAEVDAVTRSMVSSWVRAWDEAQAEMHAAVDALLEIDPPNWPTRWQIQRATRARTALAHVQDRLTKLAHESSVQIMDATGRIVPYSAHAQPWIMASQYPPGYDTAHLAAKFDRVSTRALDAIVERTSAQVTSLTRPLSAEATEAMKRSLVRGVAVGENPRIAAQQMMRRLEGDFNGGLTRAMTIARTEMLDAHRVASAAQHKENADVLAGWIWQAQLDKRTCSSCFAQSGNMHPIEEPGPWDHQQGRCARVPVTKTWKELGFDMPEQASQIPDARKVFDSMRQADRLAVMGPQRLAALDKGEISWADLSTKRTTNGWRDSYAPTALKDLPKDGLSRVGNDTPVPVETGKILDRWVQQGGTGTLTAAEKSTVGRVIDSHGELFYGRLYRGESNNLTEKALRSRFDVGKSVDFGPSSFSTDLDSALPYAESGFGGDTAVVYEVVSPKVAPFKALNVTDRAAEKAGCAEGERIIKGKFYVFKDIVVDDEGIIHIYISPVKPKAKVRR